MSITNYMYQGRSWPWYIWNNRHIFNQKCRGKITTSIRPLAAAKWRGDNLARPTVLSKTPTSSSTILSTVSISPFTTAEANTLFSFFFFCTPTTQLDWFWPISSTKWINKQHVKKWLPETSSRAALYGGDHGGVFGKLVGWTEEVRK